MKQPGSNQEAPRKQTGSKKQEATRNHQEATREQPGSNHSPPSPPPAHASWNQRRTKALGTPPPHMGKCSVTQIDPHIKLLEQKATPCIYSLSAQAMEPLGPIGLPLGHLLLHPLNSAQPASPSQPSQPDQLSQLSSAISAQNYTPKCCGSWIDLKSSRRSFFEGFYRCLLGYSQNLDLQGQPAQIIYIHHIILHNPLRNLSSE